MKTITFILTLLLGTTLVSAQDVDFTGIFTIKISDDVRIRTGGTAQVKSSGEWKKGGKIGNQSIPADTYEKMEEKLPKEYKIEILKTGKGILKDAFITNLTTNERMKGIYNVNTRDFLFGSGSGNQQNKNCGSFSLGIVKGKLSPDKSTIEKGEIGIGFVAGCKPILISADATFYYTGIAGK